jgi:crotonobetainyl-CoA:carnitine CoA-transferase CaiB-like acyl-CoA transferase
VDFCDAVGRPDLAREERFADLRARARNAEACVAILDEIFAAKPRDEWMESLRRHEGDFIFTVVNDIEDLRDDPQVLANDYVLDFAHPVHGETKVLGIPVRLSETPGRVRASAPEFGQHTEQILLDVLGYDWERITELREEKVI